MTCKNCKAKVESTLKDVEHVENVSVDLEKGQAEITMNQHITIDILQKALPDKYRISEKAESNIFNSI